MMSLLDDPFPTSAPGRLDYTVTGPATLRHLLLEKGDGSFWLALWNDVRVWDPVARADLFPADATASLSFDGQRTWSLYDLRRGTVPARAGIGFSLNLDVPVIPLLVRLG